jgi:hypothetical protein
MLVFGESHLRQILSSCAAYYNEARTHLALGKDAPLGRAVQRTGVIVAIPIHGLGQRIANPGAHPDHRRFFDAELHRDCVGGFEADAADVS